MARLPEHCSMPFQIESLKPGESYSRSVRVPLGEADSAEARHRFARLRNLCNQAAARLRDGKGMQLRVDAVTAMTNDFKAGIYTVCVTRTDGEEDDGDDI